LNLTIIPPDLADYQKDILYDPARFTITEASTKVGKTFSHIWGIYEEAHDPKYKPNDRFWWVAPVYSQARIAFDRLKILLISSGAYQFNEAKLTITTPLNTIIEFKTAKNHDSLFGEDVHYVVFDEAPRAKYGAFVALRSTLTATGGRMKLIGNFGGVSNWVHQLKQKAKEDPEYSYHKVTAWDAVKAGILEEEEIKQAQRDLPPKIFAALYLAEELEDEDQLISYDSMRDLLTNEHATGGLKAITCDVALHGSDLFVLMVWDGWRIIHIETVTKCEANEATELIKKLAERFKVPRSRIVYDADGLGSFLRGYLKGAKPFNNGGAPIHSSKKNKINYKSLKDQCGYEIAKRVNEAEVFIECDLEPTTKEKLFQELECLKSYDLDSDGKIRLLPKKKIKEIIGRSPDYLDAFIMREYLALKPKSKKRVTTY